MKMDNCFTSIMALGVLVYFSNLGGNPIYILDESKNAACAMEMMQRGDAVVPTFNGQLRTDKPPLHYYFMIAAYRLFGVTAFAARFFSALSGILLLVVVYRNVRKLVNTQTAFFSCLALLCSVQLTVQFHLAVPDPYLILLVTISLFSFYNGFHRDTRQLKWLYVASAFGFLAKGMIAVVLPAIILLLYLLILKQLNWSILKRLKLAMGVFIFAGIAFPWYIAVGIATEGEWLRGFFIEHNLERYTSTLEGHRGFPFSPFVILWIALLPFSVFIVQAVKLALKDWQEKSFFLFCIIVCVVFAGFFSFSKTILPSYPAPAIPFLSIVLGNFLSQWVKGHRFLPAGIAASQWTNFVSGMLISCAGLYAMSVDPAFEDIRHIALIFSLLPFGSLLGWYFFRKQNRLQLVYAWSGSWILLALLFFYYAYPRIDMQNPVRETIPLIRESYPKHRIIGYKQFNPAYVFNLKQVIGVIETPEEIEYLAGRREKILVITRSKYLPELTVHTSLRVIYRGKDLFEKNETVLLSNDPALGPDILNSISSRCSIHDGLEVFSKN